MKRILLTATAILLTGSVIAQNVKSKDVPEAVKAALRSKYPDVTKVSWEKEKGNYEANWGGKSGEDNSVLFTPNGTFVEMVKAISINE
ncbi:MAG: hypothetical protein JWR50_2185, partial [Mucilaginibacter sp.]|nr:hypothetical protein [Mucilaginibacter sp.]